MAPPTAAAIADQDPQQLRKTLSKYALPSASEIRQLHAADPTNSYRSSFFRLQIDELLSAVQSTPSTKSSAGLQALLFEIKNIFDAMGEQQVTQEALQASGLPVRNHVKRKEIVLPFQKPARLDVVGSFILKNMAFSRKSYHAEYGTFTVDITVEIPADCFLPKDFANYRYNDKRNLYLGVLLAELQSHSQVFSKVSLVGFNGDYDKPIGVLRVHPSHLEAHNVKLSKMCIRIIPVISSDVFKLSKLAPSRNNIRHDPNMTEEEMTQCRTPLYNNSILEDMMFRQHTRELHTALTESSQFAEACVLAKVWVRQHGFNKAADSINGFLVSMLLLYLYNKKRITAQTPSDLMYKVLLQFISSHDIKEDPLIFPPTEGGVALTTAGLEVFRASFDVVFLDSSGRLNLFSRLTLDAWKELQNAALDGMKMAQRGSTEDFYGLFIKKNDFWARYDQYFWLPSPAKVDEADDDTYTVDEKREINDLGLERFWMRKVTRVLTRALTDRVTLVRPFLREGDEWALDQAMPSRRKLAIGIRIDPENAWRIVDKGPSAEDKAMSADFRGFWKEKSELRRFKDGAIVEAVVWDEIPPDNKHVILETIVQYIVPAHCPHIRSREQIRTSNASLYTALDVEEHVTKATTKKIAGTSYESTMTSVSNLWVIFNAFAKTIRELESLPLKVTDLLPVHSAFRYTSLFPVQPHPLAFSKGQKITAASTAQVNTVLEPLSIQVKFERSSAWPTEKDALMHAKTGFYVLIGHELETRHHLRCEVGIDCVDVFTSGYVFRIQIDSEKELNVVTGATGLKKTALVGSPEYVATLQQIEYLPRHSSMIHALHTKNTSFGPTVRLAQRWLADNLMSNVMRIEAVELLVAHAFVNATPTSMPHSILSGFLRFLKLVSSFDWADAPLIVDLNSSMNDEAEREVIRRFEASSSSATTHPGMFIAADYEAMDCLSSWTRSTPYKVVVQRLIAVAKLSFESLTHWLSTGASSSGWKAAFTASTSEFDAVLQLCVEKLPTKKMRFDATSTKKQAFTAHVYKNMDLTSIPVMVGFDPVQQLLVELNRKFGHVALFFMNGLDVDEIFIKWKPQAFLPTKFRAIASNGLLPLPKTANDDEDDAVDEDASSRAYAVPNIFEALAEIQRLGAGMIAGVALQPFSSH